MLFTAAILGIFVYGMIAAMLGTILPDLSQKYSLTPKQNGNIALLQAVGLMVGSFSSGTGSPAIAIFAFVRPDSEP